MASFARWPRAAETETDDRLTRHQDRAATKQGRFATDALWLPTSWDFSTWMKVPRAWAMASMVVGAELLIAVTVELMLRALADLLGAGARLPAIAGAQTAGAE